MQLGCVYTYTVALLQHTHLNANDLFIGGVDSTIFENFIYETLRSVRNDEASS